MFHFNPNCPLLPIPANDLLWFTASSVLLILAPGPDILFLIAQGMSRGPRAGLMTALGLAAGNIVHTALAALGVSVLFRTSEVAFQLLKFAGVAYLLLLALQAIRHRHRFLRLQTSELPDGYAALFWKGVLANVLNPKVALFFLAFLPQFIVLERGGVASQAFLLGLIFILLTALIFGLIGHFAGAAGDWLARHTGINRYFAWITAGVFTLLALRLALVAHPT